VRKPCAFDASRSQSALAIGLGPVADEGSMAPVAGDALGGWQLGEAHERAARGSFGRATEGS
jgi:hypothetical protein